MYSWLEQRWMGKHQKVLTNAGFMMETLHAAKAGEVSNILKLFELPGHRLKMRLLIDSLQSQAVPTLSVSSDNTNIEAKRIALQQANQGNNISKQVITDDGDVANKRNLFERSKNDNTQVESGPVPTQGRKARSNTAFRQKKAGIAAALQRQMLSGFAPPGAGRPAFRPPTSLPEEGDEEEDEEELPDLPPPAWGDEDEDVISTETNATPETMTNNSNTTDASNDTNNQEEKDTNENKKKLFALLSGGAMFRKYKRGSGKDRLIWCDDHINNIFWGDKRRSVKGQMQLSNVKKIVDGCQSAKKQQNAFTIVASDRTLELEALNEGQNYQWREALGLALKQ